MGGIPDFIQQQQRKGEKRFQRTAKRRSQVGGGDRRVIDVIERERER